MQPTEIHQLWQIFLSGNIILGLPHILFSPDLSSSSNQKFLSGWDLQFVKMYVFFTLLFQNAFGYFNGAKIQKNLHLFKETHNYETNNDNMNSAVNL